MRIPDAIAKNVAFVMYRKKGEETLSYAGTCFFVQMELRISGRALYYMVTAYHVIANIAQNSEDGLAVIRANLPSGDVSYIRSEVQQWHRHPTDTSVDIAVALWQPRRDDHTVLDVDVAPIGPEMFATNEVIEREAVGIGDDVFIIGLFSRFVGDSKNLPIVRMGSVALMPSEQVPTAKFGKIDAFLIECRSIGGLSGSPVFLFATGPRVISKDRVTTRGLFYLLGVMHGHWDTPGEGPTSEKLNVGIAIVSPAQRLLEILEHPEFKKQRSDVEERDSRR